MDAHCSVHVNDSAEAPDLLRRNMNDAGTLSDCVLPLTVTAWEASVETLESISARVDLSHVPQDDTQPTEKSIARSSWHPAESQILDVIERAFEGGTTEPLKAALRKYGALLPLNLGALFILRETTEVELTDREGTACKDHWYGRCAC